MGNKVFRERPRKTSGYKMIYRAKCLKEARKRAKVFVCQVVKAGRLNAEFPYEIWGKTNG